MNMLPQLEDLILVQDVRELAELLKKPDVVFYQTINGQFRPFDKTVLGVLTISEAHAFIEHGYLHYLRIPQS